MAVYKCRVCGYIFDEEKEGRSIDELEKCPVCGAPRTEFELLAADEASAAARTEAEAIAAADGAGGAPVDLSYDPATARHDESIRYMEEIHQMAVTGKSISGAMGVRMPMPGFDDILILGAQLNPAPLLDDEPVSTMTVIGKNAKRPMILSMPVYVSHMSFGALSKEMKTALAAGAAAAGTADCSGEGGILPEEMEAAHKFIFEYVPNKYSVTDENLRNSDAIEIKIGQGTKPGMGGHLPGSKVTPEIAKARNKPVGQDVKSPSKFPEINTREDLRDLVSSLRERSDGRPVGIKIAAGHIEKDLEYCLFAEPDFVTIDGRGGATGSSPLFLRDSSSIPTVYALARARKYLDEMNSDIELVITGGLRSSGDIAKAIAMGADAVAVASAPLIAAGCQQYRICGSGRCPVGAATQDPELRKRLDVGKAAARVANYFNVIKSELETFARVTGHHDIHELGYSDIVTISREISEYTPVRHA
ncbi:MAG: glutamate synthase-related protein [Anaerovoracaceae bacterium]|jgi:glutamate synthase domain-containing protein 2